MSGPLPFPGPPPARPLREQLVRAGRRRRERDVLRASSRRVNTALCRAYNDWLAAYCSTDRRRLVGVGLLPQADLRSTIAEARRAVEHLGFKGDMLRPYAMAGRTLDDRVYDPLWSLLEELDASDYPHPDGYFPGIAAALGDRADVGDCAKVEILRDNAVRCFGLD